MITLRVNGKPVELDSPTRLIEYLRRLGVDERSVAVEVNGEILDRRAYGGRTLGPGDVVEIVRMVGGGCTTHMASGLFHVLHVNRPLSRRVQRPASPSSRRADSASARSSQGTEPSASIIVCS